jgi:hypothetical protein
MAIHVYSPASATTRRGRAGRMLDHMRIIPTQNGAIMEHHYANGDGMPMGPPDRFTHNTIQGLHDHLDEHLAAHFPSGSEDEEAPSPGKIGRGA